MKELQIDQYNLDQELLEQASKFYEVSEQFTRTSSLRDEAYEQIKELDAELNTSIRQEYIDSGTKFTEAQISSQVISHQDHKEAYRAYLNYKAKADELQSLKDAYIQRSYMLRDLVQLYIAGYFADKSVSANNADADEFLHNTRKRRMNQKRKKAS